jgi:hypothetical protein
MATLYLLLMFRFQLQFVCSIAILQVALHSIDVREGSGTANRFVHNRFKRAMVY